MDVYYSWMRNGEDIGKNLLYFEPIPLQSHLVDKNHSIAGAFNEYIKCPAATNLYKNTFVIKCAYDIELIVDHKNQHIKVSSSALPEVDTERLYSARDIKFNQFDIANYIIFFSEKSLEMSLLNPIYEDTPTSKDLIIFEGKYDISKWFRTVNPSLMYKNNKIKLKRGDVLYYVRFDTPHKIKLKPFKFNNEIKNIMEDCVMLKNLKPKLPFKIIYEMFLSKNYNKRLIKEIKNNLIF